MYDVIYSRDPMIGHFRFDPRNAMCYELLKNAMKCYRMQHYCERAQRRVECAREICTRIAKLEGSLQLNHDELVYRYPTPLVLPVKMRFEKVRYTRTTPNPRQRLLHTLHSLH